MSNEDKIFAKFGRESGFTVPDGFLEQIYTRVEEQRGALPKYRHRTRSTRWQLIRPYLYLAAMFAGIWCMMKVFSIAGDNAMQEIAKSTVKQTEQTMLDNPPQLIAEAVVSPEMAEELQFREDMSATTVNDYELEQEMQQSYTDFAQFEQEFDYEFDKQYADIDVDEVLAQAQSCSETSTMK